MPLALETPPCVNFVMRVPASASWREAVAAGLREMSGTGAAVARHLDLLEERLAGRLDWRARLAGPRPGIEKRRYGDMVAGERAEGDGLGPPPLPWPEGVPRLPVYLRGPLVLTLDLFNPGDEGGDPEYDPSFLEIELLVHARRVNPWSSGRLHDGTRLNPASVDDYARLAAYGEAFGEAARRWTEILRPDYAFSEGFAHHGTWARRGPPGVLRGSCLWPLTYWASPDPALAARVERLALTDVERARIDPFERAGIRTRVDRLPGGGLFLQYRFILGAEFRSSRESVEAVLAPQAGLQPPLSPRPQ